MKGVKIVVGAVALMVAVYVFGAPYITVYQMRKAANAQDGEALSGHVDFLSLRQSLKDQMNVMMAREMSQTPDENPLVAMGVAFGGLIVERMVDTYVTPAGLIRLINKQKLDTQQDDNGSSEPSSSEPKSGVSLAYESFSKFSVTPEDNKDVKFILRRRGLGWKLTEIMLPL